MATKAKKAATPVRLKKKKSVKPVSSKKITKTAKVKKTKSAKPNSVKKVPKKTSIQKLKTFAKRPVVRARSFLKRRPHRSFRRTLRRDYKRSLKLPGYWALTMSVNRLLKKHKIILSLAVLTYVVAFVVSVGLVGQDSYEVLKNLLNNTKADLFEGDFGTILNAGLLVISTITSTTTGINSNPASQVTAGLTTLLFWLLIVWLLRQLLAKKKVSLRDGLYNCGSPLISTILVMLLIIIQAIPAGLAAIGFAAGQVTGLATVGGVESMLFYSAEILLVAISVYFLLGTFLALIIVTLPGMYPMQAVKIAGDLVVGRRFRILLRLLWMVILAILSWLLIVVPCVIFDGWIKEILPIINWLPLVPIVMTVMSGTVLLWCNTYIYTLYREIINDESPSA